MEVLISVFVKHHNCINGHKPICSYKRLSIDSSYGDKEIIIIKTQLFCPDVMLAQI